MREATVLSVLALLASMAGSVQADSRPASEKSFYELLPGVLKKDAALIGRVRTLRTLPAEMDSFRWLLGTWKGTARVFATPTTPARTSKQVSTSTYKLVPDSPWIWSYDSVEGPFIPMPAYAFDLPSGLYISEVSPVPGAWGTQTSAGWQGNEIAFEGDISIFGIKLHERQTITKKSDTEFELLNEQRMSNGTWVPLDIYSWKKVP